MIQALLSLAAFQGTTISYETRAAAVPAILEQLGQQTKQKLEADAALANEVLVIRVDKVSPKSLLDHIALATAGVWEKKDDRLILKPDAERRTKEENERLARREAQITQLLASLTSELAQDYVPYLPNDKTARRNNAIGRVGTRLLVAIGAKELARIEAPMRVVYAVKPNRLQKPMPSQDIMTSFLREVEVDRTNGVRVSGRNPDNITVAITDLLRLGPVAQPVTANMFDDSGAPMGGATVLYTLPGVARTVDLPKQKYAKDEDFMLTLNPDSVEFGKATTWASQPGHDELDPASSLGQTILQPDFEPLSFGSEMYLHYAEKRKLNLVANLYDNSQALLLNSGPNQDRASFEGTIAGQSVRNETDGWLTISPAQPAEARRNRDVRTAARRLIQAAADGSITLDERYDYILTRRPGAPNGIGARVAACFDSETSRDSFDRNESVVRLYGALSTAQRKGGKVEVATMTAAQRTALDTAVFGANPGTIVATASEIPAGMQRTMLREPTMYFPDGISPATVLDVGLETKLEIRRSTLGQSLAIPSTDPQQVAIEMFYKAHPELIDGDAANYRVANQFQPIERREVAITFPISLGYSWLGTLSDAASKGKKGSYDALPADYKKVVQSHLDKLNADLANGNAPRLSISRRTEPPPAP